MVGLWSLTSRTTQRNPVSEKQKTKQNKKPIPQNKTTKKPKPKYSLEHAEKIASLWEGVVVYPFYPSTAE